ncbi:1-acyl-sn-glycerol-3-phosphate acyltransferase [Vicingaceae bacterium]|nr:1-acyl-sn-glycerol-3-phosphate acyltransferase [Vicingaceae bacterium]
MRLLSVLIFKITGWKTAVNDSLEIKRCVLIAAPHTSNWDFMYARAALYILRIKVKFLIKDDYFFFPLNYILKAMGAIPVDRSKAKGNKVESLIDLFNTNEELVTMIPAEGTRSLVKEFRKGFYHVANGAKVPIALGYLDYKKKIAGVGPLFYPTGDIDQDLQEIYAFYRTITAKHPKDAMH